MMLKLLKLNANDAISNGPVATSKSGSVILRKTCHAPAPSTRAASTSSPGIDCNAPRQTEEVGERQPDADEDDGDPRPPDVEEPGAVKPPRQQLVDDPEVVVQQAAPDEDGQEGRDRVRQHEDHAVEALQRELLLERDRQEEPEGEREPDGQRCEHERPEEHAQERVADQRVV